MVWKLALAALLLALAWAFRVPLARALLLALLHSVYRIRVRGLERLPAGGALLCVNHLSHGDALFVGAALPRRVFFLMHRSFFRAPVVGWVAKLFDTIPVASEDSAAEKQESLRRAAERARAGELVCIFPEGAISRTGHLLGFKRGLETIARDAGVPIVPVVLDRVWGSIFSFSSGRLFWKRPERLPYPIDVIVGEPLAPQSEAWQVREALTAELALARVRCASGSRSLGYRFVRSARAHAERVALMDSAGARITYRELLQAALELACVLRREYPGEEVALQLPTGADAALACVALVLSGKTAVPQNPLLPVPAGPRIDTARLRELRALVCAEDRAHAARIGRLRSRAAAQAVDPAPAGERPAVLLWSSGSSGAPKCIVLTHANIASNVQSTSQVFALGPEDGVLGVVPFFHAMGYTATLWLPLLSGARAVFHPNPLDAPGIGALCRRERPTILLASPTFCRAYERRLEPADLESLRLCVCGSEKLAPELARAWQAKFGKPLFEGYGATELAPVAAVNVPDFARGSSRQENHRPGSVGRALPGVALRIVDPEDGRLLAPGTPGLLLVRGPNVTPGYAGDPQRTAEALRDGWYSTGDIATLDKDGFLAITDRLARFSKIGGEMVSHGRVEEALREAHVRGVEGVRDGAPDGARDGTTDGAPAGARVGADELELAVVAVPDEKRGERLVVLHSHARLEPRAWLDELARGGLPALFRPREADFVALPELPRLATGKLDLAAARAHALQR